MLVKYLYEALIAVIVIWVFYKVFYFHLIMPLINHYKAAKIKERQYEKEISRIRKKK